MYQFICKKCNEINSYVNPLIVPNKITRYDSIIPWKKGYLFGMQKKCRSCHKRNIIAIYKQF